MIETERLVLRNFTLDDVEAFYQLATDPAVTRYTRDGRTVANLDDARQLLLSHPMADYQKHGYGRWAVVYKQTGRVIGFAGLKYLDEFGEVDIGYRFVPEHWGAGLATEASIPALRYGFTQLGLERIIGLVLPENRASVRVLEKLGLRFAGMIEIHSEPLAKYVIDKADYLEARTCNSARDVSE